MALLAPGLVLRLGEILKRLTGISIGTLRPELLETRLQRHVRRLGLSGVEAYLGVLDSGGKEELELFVNSMTTNHTYFFRERAHLDFIARIFVRRFFAGDREDLNVWCAACSTGEEVYTVAMIIREVLQEMGVQRRFSVLGTDINTQALGIAKNGVYAQDRVSGIPEAFRKKYLRQGRHPHHKWFAVDGGLRQGVRFAPLNLVRPVEMFRKFDLVLCRNVFIYFDGSTIRDVLKFLRGTMSDDGVLITGLSEQVEALDPNLHVLGRSIHVLQPRSPYQHDSWQTLEIGRAGADAAQGELGQLRAGQSGPGRDSGERRIVLALGASTGGAAAIAEILAGFPRDVPPIVVAQHIAAPHMAGLVATLQRHTALDVREASNHEILAPGVAYLPPGGHHLSVVDRAGHLRARVIAGRPEDRFVPSVDQLFASLAALDGVDVIAAILTGMGDDGAVGCRELRQRGHFVLGQDAQSSQVFGMPAAAAAAGGVSAQRPLSSIARTMLGQLKRVLAGRRSAAVA